MGKDIFDLSDVLDGESPERQLEEVVLYDGPVVLGGQSVQVPDITGYEYMMVHTEFTAGGNRYNMPPTMVKPSDVLGDSTKLETTVGLRSDTVSFAAVQIIHSTSSATSLVLSAQSNSWTNAGVYKIVGYKKRYATENNSVVIPVNGGNAVTVNSQYPVQLPPEFYDPNTGLVKDGVSLRVELYASGSRYTGYAEPEWDHVLAVGTGHFYNGAKARILGNQIVVETAGFGATSYSIIRLATKDYPNPWGLTADLTSAPCQVIATLNDKTAISVPVGDKGYGGLVKTTLATTIADFTVPTVIDFDAAAVTTPLKVVQDATSNTLSINQIGIWETTGNINLGFDIAVGDRQIEVEIYNETLGQVVASTTRYIARNQAGDSIPFTVGAIEIQNVSHEYSLRIYSADSFSNVVINKCRWDVKLYSPL